MRMRTWLLWTAAALALCSAAETRAQTDAVQPGDTLRILILNRPEYTQELTVGPDGKLPYFLAGSIDTNGMTLETLQQTIAEALAEHFVDPQVIVMPTRREYGVYVGGEVKTPGFHPAPEPEIDLRRAVILAGGHLPDSADMRQALLLRKGKPPLAFNLSGLNKNDAPMPLVQNGDAVYIPRRIRIRVVGNVQKPDTYYVNAPPTAAYALALAGGPLDDKGALDRIVLLRADGASETIQLTEQFWKDNSERQPRLQSGDALFVPNAYLTEEISVIGYVRSPGLYRTRGPVPLARAVALAGGADTREADTRSIEIQRLDGSTQKVDLRTEATSTIVHPGETVRVRKRFKVNWSFVLSAVTTGVLLARYVQDF